MGIELSQLPLPKVSPSCVQLLNILSTAEPDIKKLDAIINKDPLLASTIIKYANSPLYRRSSKISNLQTALNLLGLKNIRSAVVMTIMRSDNKKQNKIDESVWAHSEVISQLCRLIAKECMPPLADDMQLIGLIHDIGMLVLNQYDGEKYQKLFDLSQQSAEQQLTDQRLDVLEVQSFGFSHDTVAVRLCKEFRFVEQVGLVIGGYHCHFDKVQSAQVDVSAKHSSAKFSDEPYSDVENDVEADVENMISILSLAHHLESFIESGTTSDGRSSVNTLDYDYSLSVLQLDESKISRIIDVFQR